MVRVFMTHEIGMAAVDGPMEFVEVPTLRYYELNCSACGDSRILSSELAGAGMGAAYMQFRFEHSECKLEH